jgi:outer membrane protein
MRVHPFLLILALSAALLASLVQGADLLEVCRLTFNNSTDLRQQEAATLAAHEATPQARAGLLPSINLSANVTRNRRDTDIDDGVGGTDILDGGIVVGQTRGTSWFTSKGYTLSLAQPVYRRERFVQLRQAKASIRQSEAQIEATRQALVVRAAQNYFNVLAALDNLEFARAEREAIARQLEQAKQRFDVGLIAITDVQEAQARFDLARSREIAAENQLANAREALRELTGTETGELTPLGQKLPLAPPRARRSRAVDRKRAPGEHERADRIVRRRCGRGEHRPAAIRPLPHRRSGRRSQLFGCQWRQARRDH